MGAKSSKGKENSINRQDKEHKPQSSKPISEIKSHVAKCGPETASSCGRTDSSGYVSGYSRSTDTSKGQGGLSLGAHPKNGKLREKEKVTHNWYWISADLRGQPLII